MTRDELINWLSRLVMDGIITEEEAAQILDAFDRDEDLDLWGIPIPPPLALEMPGQFDFVEYVAVLSVAQAASMRRGVRPVYPSSPDAMMDSFERDARRLAQLVYERSIDVAEWQRRMRRLITEYTVGQVVMGGRLQAMTPALQQRLQRELRLQFAYLSRFADEVALGRLSEARIGARGTQYGGYGRGEFYRERESSDVGQFGMVVDYLSQDDPNTCVPCYEAQENGPYLPGSGPFPGQVCLGAGSCRCERVIRYDPSSYSLLTRRS
jgi:hypothetical protein